MDETPQDLYDDTESTLPPEPTDVTSTAAFDTVPEPDPRDLDGDGIVNLEEVSAYNEQQRQDATPTETPQAPPVTATDPRDLDGDGIVNLEEVSAYNEQQRQDAAPAETPQAPPVTATDPRDLDGDGIVNLEEVSAYNEQQAQQGSPGPDPAVVLEPEPAADPRDTNNDGVVSLEEVSADNERSAARDGTSEPVPDQPPAVVLEPVTEPGATPDPAAPVMTPEQIQALALERARARRAQFESLIAQQSTALPPRPTPVQTVVHVVHESAPPAPPAPVPEPDYTDLADVRRALDALGVESELVTGATLDQLQRAFADGRGVVLSIDGDELLIDDDALDGGRDADRAFYVTDIDLAGGVVRGYMPPDGDTVSIPLDRVLDAWEDSGNEMLVIGDDEPEPNVVSAEAPDDDGGDNTSFSPHAGLVMLPLAIGAVAGGGAWTVRSRRRAANA